MFDTLIAPRITHAACDFWFEAGSLWNPETVSRRFEQSLAPGAGDGARMYAEPCVWVEPDFLSVTLRRPACDWEEYLSLADQALTVYQVAAQPRALQSVSLRYDIDLPRWAGTVSRTGARRSCGRRGRN